MNIGNIRYTYNPRPNPTLHYKLDPGEPGIASPTSASQSVGKVASHELTNLRRFKREAAEDGGIVVESSIYVNFQQKGAFLAATSGKSKARVLIPDEKPTAEPELPGSVEETEKNKPELLFDPILEAKITNLEKEDQKLQGDSIKKPVSLEDSITKEQNNLEEEKGRLKQLINKAPFAKDNLESLFDKEKDNVFLENKLERIEARLSYLEQLEEARKMNSLYTGLTGSESNPLIMAGIQDTGAEITAGNWLDVQV